MDVEPRFTYSRILAILGGGRPRPRQTVRPGIKKTVAAHGTAATGYHYVISRA